jgi:hypothetical protein
MRASCQPVSGHKTVAQATTLCSVTHVESRADLSSCRSASKEAVVPARSKRIGASVLVAAGGPVLCLALDHYWWSRQPLPRGLPNYPPLRIAGTGGPFESASGDTLFVAIPFYVLAVLVACSRIRLLAASVAVAAIAVLTVLEYEWANTTDSSTAELAFVGAVQFGIPIAITAWGLDRFLASRAWRRR